MANLIDLDSFKTALTERAIDVSAEVVVDVKETPQESFYEVVWAAGLAVRQGVKRNSLVLSSAPVGSILHIVEEITERCFGRSYQRGCLADGRGWVTISETGLGSSEPNVYMRESAKPFATGADVVPDNGDTFLLLASKGGYHELLEYLLSLGAEVNKTNNKNLTPLIAASESSHARVVQLLVNAGADINAVGGTPGRTALFGACRNGHVEVVKMLLGAHADVGIRDVAGGNTPIHAAAAAGHFEVVKLLLSTSTAHSGTPNNTGCTPLYFASANGRLETVLALLQAGADFSASTKDGWTPLHSAATEGHVDVVSRLLAAGANVDTPNNAGSNALHNATCKGHVKVISLLLAAGAAVNMPDKDGWTPLNLAAETGYVKAVSVLLAAGANICTTDKNGMTPLHWVACNSHVELVPILLAANADFERPEKTGWTPVNIAADKGAMEVVKLLVAAGADVNTPNRHGNTPLYNAALKRHSNINFELVSVLLAAGADVNTPNKDGWTPLAQAVLKCQFELLSILLRAGANVNTPNSIGETPLHLASSNGHLEIAKALLASGADVNTTDKDGWTPLNCAAHRGRLEVLKMLIATGASLNTPNKSGRSAVHNAVINRHVKVLSELVAAGADVGEIEKDGWTPLNIAADMGPAEVVEVLITRGTNVNMPNRFGYTPLYNAANSGRMDVMTVLLAAGADVGMSCAKGMNPLLRAAFKGHVDLLKLLLASGADVDSCDDNGVTPLNIAAIEGHLEVVSVLLAAGADFRKSEKNGASILLQVVSQLLAAGMKIHGPSDSGITPLEGAVHNKYLKLIKLLIDGGADPSTRNQHGQTALNLAAGQGHLDAVLTLLAAGAEAAGTPDEEGMTPLHCAVLARHLNVVPVLVAAGADVNALDNYGAAPLHIAARDGNAELVATLLTAGADLNRLDRDGKTPLQHAAWKGQLAVVSVLIASGAEVSSDNYGETPLNAAASEGHADVVSALLTAGAAVNKPDKNGMFPLYTGAGGGYLNVVSVLLFAGADVCALTKEGKTPLHAAAGSGHVDVVSVLLKAGADVNKPDKDGMTPLHASASKGHLNVVSLLLLSGSELDKMSNDGTAPLNSAASAGHVEVVSVLMGAGANLFSLRCDDGKNALDNLSIPAVKSVLASRGPPLELAVEYGFNALFKALLRDEISNLRISIQTADASQSLYPLLEAVIRHKNVPLLVWMVELGADMHATGEQERGCLIEQIEDAKLRSLLLRIQREKDCKFPIHSALRCGLLGADELAAIISRNHLTVCEVDYMGCTAYQVAEREVASAVVTKEIMLHASRYATHQLDYPCMLKCDSGFESFRLNIPIMGAKVYFEATIASDGFYSIGFVPSAGPLLPARGIGVDGSTRCVWFRGEMYVIPFTTKWVAGTVVGVGIDLTEPVPTFECSFNGQRLTAPNLPSLVGLGGEVVAVVQIEGGEYQKVDLAFGERQLKYLPAGYSSVYEYSGKSFHRCIQVWDDSIQIWRNLQPTDGYSTHYWDDWATVVSDETKAQVVRDVMLHHIAIAEDLVHMKDACGRALIGIASAPCRKVIDSILHFMSRYEFLSKIPEHKSSTCMLYLAKDFKTEEVVAVKLMNNEASFKQELESRAIKNLNSEFVIEIVNNFNGDEDEELRVECQRKGFGDYNYCIVMPAAQRNLHQILSQENVAGKDWPAIRRMFYDICQCVAHLHSCGLIHGDIKPLNIMRSSKGKMILIDLDTSRDCGQPDIVGKKFSSAYCPPEAVWVDTITERTNLHFLESNSLEDAQMLLSQPSFDMWSLGATLYQMCAGEPLFLSTYDNMLDHAGLLLLQHWDNVIKAEKLEKITDVKARNMVARLLCKDPPQRMSIAAVLVHPFVTGTAPVRMVGDPPKYDVFISYRVASDSENVRILYEKLTAEGLTVFWDKFCLPDGVPWEEGFCDGLVQSKIFVCLISRDAVGHTANSRQCFNRLTASSACDNVLLEHQLALELRAMGLIEFIYPVFIGDERSDGSHATFDWGCYGTLPDVVVSSVLEKLTGHLSRQALGVPLDSSKTVKEIVADINANQGMKIEGDHEAAFDAAKSKIVGLCRQCTALGQQASSPGVMVAESRETEQQKLIDELRAENDRAKAEKQLLEAEKERADAAQQLLRRLEREEAQEEVRQMQSKLLLAEAEKQQLLFEKQRAEAAFLMMRQQMESEIASLRAQLGQS